MLLLGAGLVSTSYLGVQLFHTQVATERLGSQRVLLARQTADSVRRPPLSPTDAHQLRAEMGVANAVLAQLSLPWDRLFKDIGVSQQDRIALLSIVPDAPKRSIKITGEARDLTAVLAYIRLLQKTRSLSSVYLTTHHVELRAVEKPVRFTITASWVIRR